MAKNEPKIEFIKSFNLLFYVSKVFGLVCYTYVDYYRNKVLVSTILGNVWSVMSLVLCGSVYHYIVAGIYFDGKSLDSGANSTIFFWNSLIFFGNSLTFCGNFEFSQKNEWQFATFLPF